MKHGVVTSRVVGTTIQNFHIDGFPGEGIFINAVGDSRIVHNTSWDNGGYGIAGFWGPPCPESASVSSAART